MVTTTNVKYDALSGGQQWQRLHTAHIHIGHHHHGGTGHSHTASSTAFTRTQIARTKPNIDAECTHNTQAHTKITRTAATKSVAACLVASVRLTASSCRIPQTHKPTVMLDPLFSELFTTGVCCFLCRVRTSNTHILHRVHTCCLCVCVCLYNEYMFGKCASMGCCDEEVSVALICYAWHAESIARFPQSRC